MSSTNALAPEPGARAGASTGRPRFALRFHAGRGILALASPLAFAGGAITELEADLGRLPSPLDLRSGARKFRHRRARVLRVTVRVDLDALAAAVCRSDGSLDVRVLDTRADRISIAMRDPIRTIASTLIPGWDGEDLVLALRDVRAAIDGPRGPTADALFLLRTLGAPLDPQRGVLRIADPLRDALTEAMVPHGWRVPELRGMERSVAVDARALVLHAAVLGSRTSDDDDAATEARGVIEESRALGPVLVALDRDVPALAIAHDVAERIAHRSPELDALIAELAVVDGEPCALDLGGARGDALRLREALQRRDPEAAATCARALDAVERSDDLAIEALRAAAALAREDDPPLAAGLAERALARRPRDAELALEWLDHAAAAPSADELRATARVLCATAVGPRRAEVLRVGATVLERAGAGPAELLPWWQDAVRLAPSDAAAREGLARVLTQKGDVADALDAWDRAATLRVDEDGAARALLEAALLARRLGHDAGAIARLETAVARARTNQLRAEIFAELATAHRAVGAHVAAARADAALLDLSQTTSTEAVVRGLFEAARAASAQHADALARAALAALTRLGAPLEQVQKIERALDAQAFETLEQSAPEQSDADPIARAQAARTIAERLRAGGRLGDAARALARAGVIMRDAATLRAAVELAEKAHAWDAALEVIDRAIDVVGAGPARAALEARRDAIRGRRPPT